MCKENVIRNRFYHEVCPLPLLLYSLLKYLIIDILLIIDANTLIHNWLYFIKKLPQTLWKLNKSYIKIQRSNYKTKPKFYYGKIQIHSYQVRQIK